MARNIYVVRQHALVFVVFVLGGTLFCVFPWMIDGMRSVFARAFFTLLGLLSICVGLLAWKTSRVGLVVDRHGIWCGGYSLLRMTLVPWEAVLGVRKVTWTSPEGDHEGVLLGLSENTIHPLGDDLGRSLRETLERRIGEVEYSNPLLLGHDEWDWRPDDFVALASRCIQDPKARDELGEYRGAP